MRGGSLRSPRGRKAVKVQAVALYIIAGRHVFQPARDQGIESKSAALVEPSEPLVQESWPIGAHAHWVPVLDEPPTELNQIAVPGGRSADPDLTQCAQVRAFIRHLVVFVNEVPLEGLGRGNEVLGKWDP